MRRLLVHVALVLLVASPAFADVRVGPVRLTAPARPNGGPDRFGVSSLRIEVENTSSSPVTLRTLSVKLKSRRIVDSTWTTQTLRVPGAAYLEGQPDTNTRAVTIPPGRHTLVVRFDRIAAFAYGVHSAEVTVQVREGRSVRRGVVALPVTMTRRHPLLPRP